MSGLFVLPALLFLSVFAPNYAISEYPEKYKAPPALQNRRSSKSLYWNVDAAMNQALDALNHIRMQLLRSRNGPERLALSDCCKFYEFAIMQLNRTLNSSRFFDTQIWLSSALSNHEYLEITSQMKNIVLVGDGMERTIITGDRSFAAGYTTYQSATVKVLGDGFVARDITFRNAAGPKVYQAVALYSSSDHSAFYRCGFEGYQDTLCAESNRQFYQECHIYGTIDFIFGNAAVVLQNSYIYARKPIKGQSVVITAHGRSDQNQPTGIAFINCKVQAGPDLKPVLRQYKAFLGRPWREYSRTVYLKSYVDSLIHPLGWLEWDNRGSTVYYAEYGNYGPGSSTKGRVKWPGYKRITNVKEAQKFSVSEFIDGQAWLPATGVPFSDGLSV